MAQKVDLANRDITDMSNDEQKLVLEELKISRALLEYQQQQQQQQPQQFRGFRICQLLLVMQVGDLTTNTGKD